MKKKARKEAATCLVFTDDGKVLAVSRKDDPSDYGLPGGKRDASDVSLADAAARELEEETGLIATSLKKIFSAQDGDFYTTTFLTTVEGEIDTNEAGKVAWINPEVLFDGCFGVYNRDLFAHLENLELLEQFVREIVRQ